jgi:hypothetical protein
VEQVKLGLFRGRLFLFFRFRVAFWLYIRTSERASHFEERGGEPDNKITSFPNKVPATIINLNSI